MSYSFPRAFGRFLAIVLTLDYAIGLIDIKNKTPGVEPGVFSLVEACAAAKNI
jgi:hypothetical protein